MTKTGPQRAAVRRLVFAFWVAILSGVDASTVTAGPQAPAERGLDRDVTFNIPPQPLGPALVQFSKQADVQVMVAASTVDKQTTSGVTGTLRVRTALVDLLRNSGLTYTAKDNTVTVVPASASGVAGHKSFRFAEAGPTPTAAESSGPAEARRDEDNTSDSIKREGGKIEEVVVTGSHIRGVQSASPVMVYHADEIAQTGATTLDQFIATLPQNFGGGATQLTANAGTDPTNVNIPGDTGANLHGLGSGATLTLVNGQRLAPAGFGTYTDISMIPLSAIDRVEIVTDGSSALYGSDAVAGVINVILKEKLSGAETVVDYGSVAGSGHDRTRLAQSFGTDWAGGGALISYDYSRQYRLSSNDRPFTPPSALGTDMVPSVIRQSGFGAVNNTFFDVLRLRGDFLYSHKDTDTTDVGFNVKGDREVQYSATGSALYKFSERWNLEVSPNWSENRLEQIFFPTANVPFDDNTSVLNTFSVDAIANGDLVSLGRGGIARLAAGAEHRNEVFHSFDTTPGSSFDGSRRRSASAVFAELNLPFVADANKALLLDELSVTAAVRHEHYSDFGNSTTTKFGIRWKPVESVLFRATTGTSFRAPPLYYLLLIPQGFVYPVPDPLSATGSTTSLLLSGARPNLGPERARSTNIGIDIQPTAIPSILTTINLFHTHYFDRLQTPAPTFAGMLTNSADYVNFVTRSPTVEQVNATIAGLTQFQNPFGFPLSSIGAILDDRLQNVASVDVRGVDLGARYSHQFSIGVVGTDLNAEYISSFSNRFTPTSPSLSIVNTAYSPPRWKARWSASWARAGFSLSSAVNCVGRYTNTLVTPTQPVDAFVTLDLRASYELSMERFSLLRDLNVALSANNVFNRQPPAVANSFVGYDPTNANPFGRQLMAEVRARW